jgi:hypothetical protein
MALIIGPTQWWQDNLIAQCPTGTTLLDGSRIICKAGGTAWIVAPSCTQVSSSWAGGQYNTTAVGDKCCICEWSTLETRLINCGFNPCDWFVPSYTQLQNPGYVCRTNWDSFAASYWSSTEFNATAAYFVSYSNGTASGGSKTGERCVRAFRCVTY